MRLLSFLLTLLAAAPAVANGLACPTATTAGGAFALTAPSGQFLTGINANCLPTYAPVATAPALQSIDGTAIARHQLLDNASFQINQRGYASGTALAAGALGFDRWKAGAAGATLTFAASPPSTGVTIAAGSLLQTINAQDIQGGDYIASWSGTATCRLWQGAAAGNYVRSPATILSAAAGGAVTLDCAGGTLAQPQVEPGTTATAFEQRAIALEWQVAQFYYFAVLFTTASPPSFQGYQTAGGYVNIPLRLPAMRATPACSIVGTWTYSNASAVGVTGNGPEYAHLFFVATATGLAQAAPPNGGGFACSADI